MPNPPRQLNPALTSRPVPPRTGSGHLGPLPTHLTELHLPSSSRPGVANHATRFSYAASSPSSPPSLMIRPTAPPPPPPHPPNSPSRLTSPTTTRSSRSSSPTSRSTTSRVRLSSSSIRFQGSQSQRSQACRMNSQNPVQRRSQTVSRRRR